MKRLLWAGVPLLLLGAGGVWLGARGPLVHTVPVVRSDIEKHIIASGRVRVPTRVEVSAQVPGLVVAVGAVEGQRVRTGDLLVSLNDAEALTAVAQGRAAVAQAQARVTQLRRVGAIVTTEALRQATTNVERAATELARTRSLAAGGAAPPAELEEAVRALDIARAQQTVADAQQVSSAPQGADSRVALTALLTAQAQLSAAEVRLTQTRVYALHDGIVLSRSVEPGSVVQPAQTLLVMAADGEAELVFQSDERNIGSIALGQRAKAAADAYPQRVFDAVVNYIAPAIDPQRGSVEVHLSVPAPPAELKPEMTVSVDLTVGSVTQALGIERSAVRGLETPTPWVYAVEDGHVVRHDVTTGLTGQELVELTGGIAEGADVVVPDGRVLRDGQRVRAEPE